MRLEPLLTAEETRCAEEAHPGHPESMAELMERAGAAVADVVLGRFPGRVAVVCGKGSNGGDGRVCARVLRERGRDVTVVDEVGEIAGADVIVDALFGIGLRDAPRDAAARMIESVNAAGKPVVAVQEHDHALVPASVLLDVPRKRESSSKYRVGSVLVVGGSRGLTGAAMLAALAAFRADAGYVAVAAPDSSLPVLEAGLLEAVKRPLPEDSSGRLLPRAADDVVEAAQKADAVAIGPGLGRSDGTKELVRILLERLEAPVVLD